MSHGQASACLGGGGGGEGDETVRWGALQSSSSWHYCWCPWPGLAWSSLARRAKCQAARQGIHGCLVAAAGQTVVAHPLYRLRTALPQLYLSGGYTYDVEEAQWVSTADVYYMDIRCVSLAVYRYRTRGYMRRTMHAYVHAGQGVLRFCRFSCTCRGWGWLQLMCVRTRVPCTLGHAAGWLRPIAQPKTAAWGGGPGTCSPALLTGTLHSGCCRSGHAGQSHCLHSTAAFPSSDPSQDARGTFLWSPLHLHCAARAGWASTPCGRCWRARAARTSRGTPRRRRSWPGLGLATGAATWPSPTTWWVGLPGGGGAAGTKRRGAATPLPWCKRLCPQHQSSCWQSPLWLVPVMGRVQRKEGLQPGWPRSAVWTGAQGWVRAEQIRRAHAPPCDGCM